MHAIRWWPVVLALFCGGVLARDGHETACAAARQVPVPAADIGAAPSDCDAESLYDGPDGTGGDVVAARHCAYRERAEDVHRTFGGSGLLMMLYANGDGVVRDPALARRFACEYGGAPAELRGRLARIQRIADGDTDGWLDICDDVTSGAMAGFCTGRRAGFARVVRARQWTALQSDWTPTQRDAWQTLRTAADGYFGRVGSEEIDLSGSSRGAFAIEGRETLEIELLENVQRFERGERPTQTAASLAALDRDLNTTYREVRAELQARPSRQGGDLFGTVNADGVRDTQRAWLRYRDAWVAFAATRWPDTAGDAWRAWLTDRRTGALDAIKGGP